METVAALNQAQAWLAVAALGAVSLASFVWAFWLFHRGRVVENTATARIRSAQQGYVELRGWARPATPEPHLAPLSGTPCCWYRYQVERRASKGWRRVEGGSSEAPFLLEDDTGRCLVDPAGAEVHAAHRRVWYGSDRHPGRPPAAGGGTLARIGRLLNTEIGGERYRFAESRILEGEALYVAGLFKSEDDLDRADARQRAALELLREWKGDQAALLKRFDTDGDGRIDADEWERARDEASRIAGLMQRREAPPEHPHVIARPPSRRHPFILSTLPERRMVRHYRLRAALAITAFFLSGGATLWLLGQRLG